MDLRAETTCANAEKVLSQFGAKLHNVVEETRYVLDVGAAFAIAGKARKTAFGRDKAARFPRLPNSGLAPHG